MRSTIYKALLVVMSMFAMTLSGCKLATETDPPQIAPPTGRPVINEVFVLPSSNQNHFNWIELYNPSNETFELRGWKLTFNGQGTIVVVDTSGNVRSFELVNRPVEVPFRAFTNGSLRPYNFMTIVDNESRLLNYTAYGPGAGPVAVAPMINGQPSFIWIDSLSVDSIVISIVQFNLKSTDQLILKDSLGTVLDVVRYGDYRWPDSLGADPYAGNVSMGPIPQYQSIARFAKAGGAYWTGNTASDFYVTNVQVPQTRPIPQWISQAFK